MPPESSSVDTKQVRDALIRIFQEENRRIVFWNDSEREFENILDNLALEGVNILRLDQTPSLAVKIRVEREEPESRFLLDSTMSERRRERERISNLTRQLGSTSHSTVMHPEFSSSRHG